METIFEHQSKYQHLRVVAEPTGELVFYLDNRYQFGTKIERYYHGMLCSLTAALTPLPERALVMGGGDGLGVRELLAVPTMKRVVLAELDPAVIALARANPIARINEHSLEDPRTEVVIGDAREYLKRPQQRAFDVIISDFPAIINPQIAGLYTEGFLDQVFPHLGASGAMAIQHSENTKFLAQHVAFLRKRLGHAFGLVMSYNEVEAQGFAYASRLPLQVRSPIASDTVRKIGELVIPQMAKDENLLLEYDVEKGSLSPWLEK